MHKSAGQGPHQLNKESVGFPRVSIVTIFLNGEEFLAEAIESVIRQTFSDWEYFLVDDGSRPAATAIAKDYAARYPGKIRYLEHPDHANRGMSASRNLGIRNARGEYIAFLDADDVWLQSKLADHVAILDAYPKVGMVCGTTIYWYPSSSDKDETVPTGHRQNVVIDPPNALLAVFPFGAAAGPSMSDIVLRGSLVRQINGFEDQFTGHYESRVFLSKVFMSGPVYFDSAVSNKVRIHPASCVRSAIRDGKDIQNKLNFLEWFEGYLKSLGRDVDPRITSCLRRALRPYRTPRIHHLFLTVAKIRNQLKLRTRLRRLLTWNARSPSL